VNVSKKTASLNPTQSHYDSFEYFLDNLTIFWISEVVLRSARCVTVRASAAACHVVAHRAKMQRLRLCNMLCVDDEYAALRDQYQTQVGSPEQRLARWVIYAVLAAPIVATLLHDLGVGATYAVAGFCARYANEPAENCCAQLTEQTRSREYKSSDQRDHERKQHKVTQEHEHTYALFFISQSCPPKDLPSARFATLEPQKLFRRMSPGNGCLKKAPASNQVFLENSGLSTFPSIITH
jgi:hypothetical protein